MPGLDFHKRRVFSIPNEFVSSVCDMLICTTFHNRKVGAEVKSIAEGAIGHGYGYEAS